MSLNPPGPHFIGIGAQKAGTTWLHNMLQRHPQTWVPPIKELHYFDRHEYYPTLRTIYASPLKRWTSRNTVIRNAHRQELKQLLRAIQHKNWGETIWLIKWLTGHYSDSWYRNLFPSQSSDYITGEITPAYAMLTRQHIQDMLDCCPEAKFIYLIRHPVDRAWSAIKFLIARGYVASFDLNNLDQVKQMLATPSLKLQGQYAQTLSDFTQVLPKGRLLVGFYDAISDNPTGLMNDITQFLNIEPLAAEQLDTRTRFNPSPSKPMPQDLKDYMYELYQPELDAIAETLGSYASSWKGEQITHSQKLKPTIIL